MFQLIVGVTAVALFSALTLAGIFYSGEAFTRARERAQAQAAEKGDVRIQTTIPSPLAIGDGRWVVTDSY
ncbi:hypothetical protein OIU34_19085 [Pararhizobium sp. BT-229]|uniref:hypothetical protein n=1 Tax=Pararhizobium sp. BT-229 TaxID=2986923 RepID=UPI0021F75CE5|nr:hypothetical protein [Pararhizobium sp. BT-229]MCV9963987.1 hypothetical protein [Pararhizobium sp. BT-229]